MIDFDTAAPGTRLWDLGYSVMSWLDLGDDGYTGNLSGAPVSGPGGNGGAAIGGEITIESIGTGTLLTIDSADISADAEGGNGGDAESTNPLVNSNVLQKAKC